METPRVSIIVLNWNGWSDTIECLNSIINIDYSNIDIVIVDNGSEDNSIEMIHKWGDSGVTGGKEASNKKIRLLTEKNMDSIKMRNLPSQASRKDIFLISLKKNIGYAKGNNVGIDFCIRYLQPKYCLILNNDTVIESTLVSEFVRIGEIDKKIAIMGPNIYYYNNPNRIWMSGGKLSWFPKKVTKISISSRRKRLIFNVDFVTGSCFFIRTTVLEEVGYIPTEYFLQWEDIDLCTIVRKKGYLCVLVPYTKILHKVSSSYIKADMKPFQTALGVRNRIIFWNKHLSNIKFFQYSLFFFFVLSPVHLLYYSLLLKDYKKIRAYIHGSIKGFNIVKKQN